MKKLAAVYGGASYQNRSINESKYRKYFDEAIYLLDLPTTDLRQFKGVLIPSRLHQGKLADANQQFDDYLQGGGTVIAFGEQPSAYLPGVDWEYRPTNFWWWLEPEANSGLVLRQPEHALFRYIGLDDATWHQHGVFWPGDGVESLVVTDDGGTVLYIDQVTTPGTLVVTSLDPMYHFGSYFMPATERFLDGFLPWVLEELLSDQGAKQNPF